MAPCLGLFTILWLTNVDWDEDNSHRFPGLRARMAELRSLVADTRKDECRSHWSRRVFGVRTPDWLEECFGEVRDHLCDNVEYLSQIFRWDHGEPDSSGEGYGSHED